MPMYRYAVTEYDLDKPWVVVGKVPGLMVELPDEQSFPAWTASQWPAPRYEAQLEPKPLRPWQNSS
jgi:hypothetical protein